MDCKKFYWYGPYMHKLCMTPETIRYEKKQFHAYLHLENKRVTKKELEKFFSEIQEMTEQLVHDINEAWEQAYEEKYDRMGVCRFCGGRDC